MIFFFSHGVSKNDVKNTRTKVETSFSLYNYRSGLIPSLPYKKGGHQEHKPKTQKKKKKKRKDKERKKGMALTVKPLSLRL